MNFIKSPLNYTGNKYRLLPQILPHFPKTINHCVDLFCGGATVGFNTNAKKITLIDSNPFVINLLQYLSTCIFEELISQLEKLISTYNLTYSAKNSYKAYSSILLVRDNNGLKELNKKGFYDLRRDYNILNNKTTSNAMNMLYLLLVYGYNNDLRFNSDNQYNLPVGKTDLNKNNVKKLKEFINRSVNINHEFIQGSFLDKKIHDIILQADFVYADPPYLITNAVYNENDGWNVTLENKLLNLYDEILNNKIGLVFSNVLKRIDKTNVPLSDWINKNMDMISVVELDYNYKSASYNKKLRIADELEIIVKGNI